VLNNSLTFTFIESCTKLHKNRGLHFNGKVNCSYTAMYNLYIMLVLVYSPPITETLIIKILMHLLYNNTI